MTVTVLYDLDCGFCRWTVAQLLTWDRHRALVPVAIQSAEGQELLADVPEADRPASAHVIGPDGAVRSGGDAIAIVADVLPAGAPVALLARAAPRAARWAYRVVAHNRSRLGRLVPPGRRARADAAIASRASDQSAAR